MDSGCAVPTLSPGLRETLTAKFLTVARARWGEVANAGLASSCPVFTVGIAGVAFTLLRRAFFLAAERAGRSRPARTAMIAMTTNSSIRVNALQRIFIGCL